MEKETQSTSAEFQTQCQKDWNIYQPIEVDEKEGSIIYQCPKCYGTIKIIPLEWVSDSETQQIPSAPPQLPQEDQIGMLTKLDIPSELSRQKRKPKEMQET